MAADKSGESTEAQGYYKFFVSCPNYFSSIMYQHRVTTLRW